MPLDDFCYSLVLDKLIYAADNSRSAFWVKMRKVIRRSTEQRRLSQDVKSLFVDPSGNSLGLQPRRGSLVPTLPEPRRRSLSPLYPDQRRNSIGTVSTEHRRNSLSPKLFQRNGNSDQTDCFRPSVRRNSERRSSLTEYQKTIKIENQVMTTKTLSVCLVLLILILIIAVFFSFYRLLRT